MSSNSILLYFTAAGTPVDKYVLEYGTKSGTYIYGVTDLGIALSDRMTYLVKSLVPNTTYYFRIRASNGCAVGPWSNELFARTGGGVSFGQPSLDQFGLVDLTDITPDVDTTPRGKPKPASTLTYRIIGTTILILTGLLLLLTKTKKKKKLSDKIRSDKFTGY